MYKQGFKSKGKLLPHAVIHLLYTNALKSKSEVIITVSENTFSSLFTKLFKKANL